MKNIVIGIVIAALLAGGIIGAGVLYESLSEQYSKENNDGFQEMDPINKPDTTNGSEETSEVVEETSEADEETTQKVEIQFNAPDFTALDWEGNSVNLSDFAGKPIVLNFWATWCYYCRVEMPEFNEAATELSGVQFIMVNATDGIDETISSAKSYIEANGYNDFIVFFDTSSMAQYTYGVGGYPTTFFISADGSKIYYISGAIDYDTLLEGIALITD